MSLSRNLQPDRRTNVIKFHASSSKLNIVDYKSVLEEIHEDARDFVKIDVGDIVGVRQAPGQTNEDAPVEVDSEQKLREAMASAYEQGFEAGKTEAAKALQAEYSRKSEELVHNFESLLEDFKSEMERYDQDFDKAIVMLSLAIAKRIVAREIAMDEGAVLARSREAIRKIIGVEKIKIHVNPADEEYIREHRSELSAYADSVKEIAIEADGKVERGGCIIESELGNIDARVSTQFELIEEAFMSFGK